MNAVIPSGTKPDPRDVFEFLRHEKVDGYHAFESRSATYKQNQFGLLLADLFVKNKTSSFGEYEGLPSSQAHRNCPRPPHKTRLEEILRLLDRVASGTSCRCAGQSTGQNGLDAAATRPTLGRDLSIPRQAQIQTNEPKLSQRPLASRSRPQADPTNIFPAGTGVLGLHRSAGGASAPCFPRPPNALSSFPGFYFRSPKPQRNRKTSSTSASTTPIQHEGSQLFARFSLRR